MQLHKLCKHASELEWSGGGRAQRQREVGREGEGRSYHDTLLPFFSCLRFPSSHHWITSQAPLPTIPSSPVTLTWWMSRPFKVHSTIPLYPSWVPSSQLYTS